MRDFFYRFTWDKEFKHKFFKWALVGLCSFVVVISVGLVAWGNISAQDKILQDNFGFDEKEVVEEENDSNKFNLDFGDKSDEEKREEENENVNNEVRDNPINENNDSGDNSGQESGSQEESGGSGGGSYEPEPEPSPSPGHTHSWHTVIDSDPWTETVQVYVGNTYRCNQCGFTTTDASAISSHCSRMSHSFSTTPRYETQQIYHPGSSHQECSCGARR